MKHSARERRRGRSRRRRPPSALPVVTRRTRGMVMPACVSRNPGAPSVRPGRNTDETSSSSSADRVPKREDTAGATPKRSPVEPCRCSTPPRPHLRPRLLAPVNESYSVCPASDSGDGGGGRLPMPAARRTVAAAVVDNNDRGGRGRRRRRRGGDRNDRQADRQQGGGQPQQQNRDRGYGNGGGNDRNDRGGRGRQRRRGGSNGGGGGGGGNNGGGGGRPMRRGGLEILKDTCSRPAPRSIRPNARFSS